jgi:hypothetical protein
MLEDAFLLDIHFLILFDVCRLNIECKQNGTDDDIGEICFSNGTDEHFHVVLRQRRALL